MDMDQKKSLWTKKSHYGPKKVIMDQKKSLCTKKVNIHLKQCNVKLIMECQFCKKMLSTIGNLKAHQKTVKSCLKFQGENKKGNYICEFCKKEYQTKSVLNKHQNICKFKQNKDNQEEEVNNLKREIEVLKRDNQEEVNNLKREIEVLKRDNQEEVNNLKRDNQEEVNNLKREIEILSTDKQELKNDLINSLLHCKTQRKIIN